jgi:hypothetical protein
MKIEQLDVDYEGMAKVINELRQLYEVGDLQTKRMVDSIILSLIGQSHVIINDLNDKL